MWLVNYFFYDRSITSFALFVLASAVLVLFLELFFPLQDRKR